MVLLDAMEHPGHSAMRFAAARVLEVAAGTVACMVVSAVSNWTVRRRSPAERVPSAQQFGWHPHAARHAAQVAIAVALLPLVWHLWHVPALSQAAVSIMAVMFVLVPDNYLRPELAPALQRSAGVVFGLALLEPVLALWHLFDKLFKGGLRHVREG